MASVEHYNGNTQLSKAGTTYTYTPDQIQEYNRCKNDIHYFAEKYFTIVHIDHGKMIIPLYEYQKKLLVQLGDTRHNIVLQGRQSGKCLEKNSYINIRNKQTNEVKRITIGEFYEIQQKRAAMFD